MRSAKQFLAILICVLMLLPPVAAQDGKSPAKISPDVTIIIERQQVRFTTHKPIEEMRLQVFNQAGEAVFDSGPATVNTINWPLQNANGEQLTSGLYAYTFSIKPMGTTEARTQRGHFIVDRAKERDGADKLWITSQNDNGVGAELTLARDETATVAGTALGGGRSIERRAETSERAANDREVATETAPQTAINNLAASIAGRIAKFTGANNELGDSVITEQNGNIGIGVASPKHLLSLGGAAIPRWTSNGWKGAIELETGSAIAWQMNNTANQRAGIGHSGSGMFFFRSASDPGAITSPAIYDLMINDSGNIGVGTINPLAKLHVNGAAIRYENAGKVLNIQSGTEVDLQSPTNSVVIQSLGQRANNHVILNPFPSSGPGPFYNGNVGIGTFNPLAKLHVEGTALVTPGGTGGAINFGTPNAETGMSITGPARADIRFDGVTLKLVAGPPNAIPSSTNGIAINTVGGVGVGTTTPLSKLHVQTPGLAETRITSGPDRAVLSLENSIGPTRYMWTVESGLFGIADQFGVYNVTANKPGLQIDGKSLLVTVKALQITGGADLSEKFDVLAASDSTSNGEAQIQPGMVVAIDPKNPGKLTLSNRAYDRRVAGVISGAGGVEPGMMMGQAGTLADGKHPVALTGRVYVWVDATRGAIRPGDLLTTSATPGHAMKVTNPARAQGAIIGKAMTGLKRGKGLVLVLVTLQ
ncbi:MAG: hypothetical protein JMDDDDMK_01106 [Acidobacteria bacterium]|nr:hypothetical protein [Acidobacteriota bacterium]